MGGGVDILDQLMEYYRTFYKTRKWSVKVIHHFFDLAIVNAYQEYKRAARFSQLPPRQVLDLMSFRLQIGEYYRGVCQGQSMTAQTRNLYYLKSESIDRSPCHTKGKGLTCSKEVNQDTSFENTPQLYDMCLRDLQEIISRIGGQSLSAYNLFLPETADSALNVDYMRETSYNRSELQEFVDRNILTLTEEQGQVYEDVLSSVTNPLHHDVFFLDAPGGTGKTFLINLILAKIRSQSKIALAVASSGLAATLLPCGQTAHSMFKIPIDVNQMEFPMCSICLFHETLQWLKSSENVNFVRKR